MPGKYIETWQALESIYKEGKVKAIGVCNCLQHHLKEIFEAGEVKPMLLQNEFHPRLVQQSLLDFSKENRQNPVPKLVTPDAWQDTAESNPKRYSG